MFSDILNQLNCGKIREKDIRILELTSRLV